MTTICPDNADDVVTLTFNLFSLENNSNSCYDELTIYDGEDTNAPIIPSPGGGTLGWCWDRSDPTPAGSGDLLGETIISRDESGCLTLAFSSDNFNTREGWDAAINCSPRLTVAPLSANPGESFSTTIVGLGTSFTPGTTTCAELSLGTQSYFINGDATSPTIFEGDFDLPSDAPSGLYDVTIFLGPGCVSSGFASDTWSCTQCFQVLGTNLPVEWLHFTAEAKNTEVLLSWATATEENTSHFEVERSKDGIHWESLKIVPAAGNSTDVMNYSLNDDMPYIGTNYYQVKQVDLDGSEGYSEINAVVIEADYGYFEVRPNPVTDGDARLMITSELSEDVDILITSVNGEILRLMTFGLRDGVNNLRFEINDLPNGIYFVEIIGDQEWETKKLIKL